MGKRAERKERAEKRLLEVKAELLEAIEKIREPIDKKYHIVETAALDPRSPACQETQHQWNRYFKMLIKTNPQESHMYRKAFRELEQEMKDRMDHMKECKSAAEDVGYDLSN